MNEIKLIVWILSFVVAFLSIIALLYIISAQRRRTITWKKIDYLVEDITYKSEMLNSTVETVSKISNYVDVFEVFARKNIKTVSKVIANNKDEIYKVLNKIKKIATDDTKKPKERK